MHRLMCMSVPSLHRESTNSLIHDHLMFRQLCVYGCIFVRQCRACVLGLGTVWCILLYYVYKPSPSCLSAFYASSIPLFYILNFCFTSPFPFVLSSDSGVCFFLVCANALYKLLSNVLSVCLFLWYERVLFTLRILL